ncbi:MAG TPA: S41 family peptidase [Thermoanaerobaculia bacterium]|nr:S41 family peptidase [Thermoanaerobaculia bacterium]
MTTRIHRIAAVAFTIAVTTSAFAQFGPEPDFTVTAEERGKVIENSIARLNERYVFPEVAKKMEEAVRAKASSGEYDKITSARELAETLTRDFREVSKDKHLGVRHHSGPVPDRDPDASPSAAEVEAQKAFATTVNYGFEKAERLRGNIGYIDIRGFMPPEIGAETGAAAMTFVANTDALIVDLRFNGGGEPAMVAFLTSYLFDEPTHLNDIWTRHTNATQEWWTSKTVSGRRFGGRKPVYVLTSKNTFSGGEEFANNLKVLKRATIIGETTGGGAHPVSEVKISEHFTIGVPDARAINPITKTNWEGTGVAPDVSIAAPQALDKAYLMALEQIVASTTDPRRKAGLQRVLDEKKQKTM